MSITKNTETGVLTYTPELLFGKQGKFFEAMYLLPVRRDEIKKSNGSIAQTPGWENY